jgi:hypothetical protein
MIRSILLGLCVIAGTASLQAKDDVPQWLTDAARQATPASAKNAPAVVLLQAADVVVEDGGKIVTTERYALRILKREGDSDARVVKPYFTDTGKVRDLRAWVINGDDGRRLGKERILDFGAGDGLYEQARARVIDGSKDCTQGSIFGYESVVEEKSVFTQLDWDFQTHLPAVVSRYTLRLPAGWDSKVVTLNHAPIAGSSADGGTSWELRDLPFIEHEPASPPLTSLVPRLAVSIFPPGGTRTVLGQTFANWTDVSRYASGLADPQSQPDAAIIAKVAALTANAHSDMDKIRAIATYVQNVKYISVQTGLGRGGGYEPHPAAFVFEKSYGDCKDKANLMRAMLRAASITSYPVLIYSGDPRYVREEWPSPQQFNHCILAILVGKDIKLPATVEHPSLGRLLIFDATDPYTPLGNLPDHEQHSFALIAAGDKGALLRMPDSAADDNRVERKTEFELTASGEISGKLEESFYGAPAVHARSNFRYHDRGAYDKTIERWMNARVQGVAVSAVTPTDDFTGNQFHLDLKFQAPHYAQLSQNRLLIFKPVTAPHSEFAFAAREKREYPIELASDRFVETVTVKLPEGFDVDELPDPGKLDGDFGHYESTCAVAGRTLTCKRTMQIKAQLVAPAQYPALRDFLGHVAGADAVPVVLVRK